MNISGRQSKPINHECTHGHYNNQLNGGINHVAREHSSDQPNISSSPPASNTLVWGKCLTLACSNGRSRVSCSLIKLINNNNYNNNNNNVEHVDVWQADDSRHYTKRRPRWWHRGHRPCHLIAHRDIVTHIQSACTAFSVEHVKVWQGGR